MRPKHEELTWKASRRDGLVDLIAGEVVTQTFPADELPKWAAFYRRMAADYSKKNPTYQRAATALEAIGDTP